MTLANARAKASAKAKQIYNTGITYDHHLRLSKYFYSTGHWILQNCSKFKDSKYDTPPHG
jgi:hypothetical protein